MVDNFLHVLSSTSWRVEPLDRKYLVAIVQSTNLLVEYESTGLAEKVSTTYEILRLQLFA